VISGAVRAQQCSGGTAGREVQSLREQISGGSLGWRSIGLWRFVLSRWLRVAVNVLGIDRRCVLGGSAAGG